PDPVLPYQVFARDSSAMTPGGAVITQLHQSWRRGEYAAAIRFYQSSQIPIHGMITAGALEGGDVMILEPGCAVIGAGEARTQEQAARQLAGWLAEDGWEVRVEPIPERYVHIDVLLAVLADRRELDRRTGGTSGARRLCWGDGWREARSLLGELLGEIGLAAESDAAGNLWAVLEGEAEPALALGSHLDSVPDGGWLDGALGVMAALGVLRAWSTLDGSPPRTLMLVDWADEEGARFGRSLVGSS